MGTGLTFRQKSAFGAGGLRRAASGESTTATDASQSMTQSGTLARNAMQEETLAQKKQRLFKWNTFQNVKMPIDFVKQ